MMLATGAEGDSMRWIAGLIAALAVATVSDMAMAAPAGHPILQVTLAPGLAPTSGRLLVFAEPIAAAEARAKEGVFAPIDARSFGGGGAAVAAQEIPRIAPGRGVEIDLDALAFPQAFSRLPPGDYAMQALLDVNRNYNYSARGEGDIVSPVVRIHLPLEGAPPVVLEKVLTAGDPWAPTGAMPEQLAKLAALRPHAQPIVFVSPSLSAFWGRPTTMKGWVVTPPGYQARSRVTYPTIFYTHGFGGTDRNLLRPAADIYAAMAAGQTPPMIWVLLDESSATGTHEFADSVNNGPWGHALTAELIPDLERHYRMDARASGR